MSPKAGPTPQPDLIITFRASSKLSHSKRQLKSDILQAEQQYKRLLETLSYAGLKAVGRRGEQLGDLMVFVACPKELLADLVKRERHSDFMYNLPTSRLPSEPVNLDAEPLSPSDRLRHVHSYVTSTPSDGGLGISPDAQEWSLIESIMVLHDREFNESWVNSWTYKQIIFAKVSLTRVRDQWGDAVAMYFAFLSTYTRFLVFPSALGLFFYFFSTPYSPTYSILLLLWSTVFTEYWRIRERLLSLHFGTRGSFRVEKRRHQYKKQGFTWWKRELRVLASVPVIVGFVILLTCLLTAIFIFEAFVTQLYNGPGHRLVSFSPTILFVLLVPRLISVYQILAKKFTTWENHAHQSTHDASMTIKSFILSALVAYSGLALSAFVYVPFGEGIMQVVQVWLWEGVGEKGAKLVVSSSSTVAAATAATANAVVNGTLATKMKILWESDLNSARRKLNPGRLRDQMFAYTVTNQVVNTFIEVGLPYVLRAVNDFRNGKKVLPSPLKDKDSSSKDSAPVNITASAVSSSISTASVSSPSPSTSINGTPVLKKKKVIFEDEKSRGGEEELAFLDLVREEVALPEYELFGDYNEMVMQFGYVVMWSGIWYLAPLMALLNNILELRSDAFKITVHQRRPIPQRTDTIGPWLEALTFLTWLAALSNSALAYLFCPRGAQCDTSTSPTGTSARTPVDRVHSAFFAPGENARAEFHNATQDLALRVFLIALAASHGYLALRWVVRRVLERVIWRGSEAVIEKERRDWEVKETFLRSVGGDIDSSAEKVLRRQQRPNNAEEVFWGNDEGLQEIARIAKEA